MTKRPKSTTDDAIDVVTAIRKIDPKVQCGSDEWMAYATCLASTILGPNPAAIADFMRIPKDLVERFGKNLIRSGVWQDGNVCSGWYKPDGNIELVLDVSVALGHSKRVAEHRKTESAKS